MTDEEFTEAAKPLVKRWRKKPFKKFILTEDGLVPVKFAKKFNVKIPALEGKMFENGRGEFYHD